VRRVELRMTLHIRRLARLRSVGLAFGVIDDGAALRDFGVARTAGEGEQCNDDQRFGAREDARLKSTADSPVK
jgi:hypothetical protein